MYGKKKLFSDWNKIMSIRCKVCNASKIINIDKMDSNVRWECQICGNMLDVDGYVISSN
jgi:transcription elongation factor Elf1